MNWDVIGGIGTLALAIVAQYVQLTNRLTKQQVRLDHSDKNHERLEQTIKEHNDRLERYMADHAKRFDQVVDGISEIKRLLAKSGIE
jgi:hypothetical protein